MVLLALNFGSLSSHVYASSPINPTSQLDFRQSSIPPNNTKVNNLEEIKHFLEFRNTGEININNLVFTVNLVNSLEYISCHTPTPKIRCSYDDNKKQILFKMETLAGLGGKKNYPDFYEIYFISRVNSNQSTALSNVFTASSKQAINLNSNIIYHIFEKNPSKYGEQISNFENLEKIFSRSDLQKDKPQFQVKTNPPSNFSVNQNQNLIYTLEIKLEKNQNKFIVYSLLDANSLQDFKCLAESTVDCFFSIYKGKILLVATGNSNQDLTKLINLSAKVKPNTTGKIDQQFLLFLPQSNQLFASKNLSNQILELKTNFNLIQHSDQRKALVEANQELTYFINFDSPNLSKYKSIIITTKLDPKLEYIESSCFPNNSKGQTCSLQADNTLVWRLNNLDSSDPTNVAFRANLKKDAQGQLVLNSQINSGNITQTSQPLIQNIRQKNSSSLIILDSKIPNGIVNTTTAYPKLSIFGKQKLESINRFSLLNIILPRTGGFMATGFVLSVVGMATFLLYKHNQHLKISKKLDLKPRIGEDNLISKLTTSS